MFRPVLLKENAPTECGWYWLFRKRTKEPAFKDLEPVVVQVVRARMFFDEDVLDDAEHAPDTLWAITSTCDCDDAEDKGCDGPGAAPVTHPDFWWSSKIPEPRRTP